MIFLDCKSESKFVCNCRFVVCLYQWIKVSVNKKIIQKKFKYKSNYFLEFEACLWIHLVAVFKTAHKEIQFRAS